MRIDMSKVVLILLLLTTVAKTDTLVEHSQNHPKKIVDQPRKLTVKVEDTEGNLKRRRRPCFL